MSAGMGRCLSFVGGLIGAFSPVVDIFGFIRLASGAPELELLSSGSSSLRRLTGACVLACLVGSRSTSRSFDCSAGRSTGFGLGGYLGRGAGAEAGAGFSFGLGAGAGDGLLVFDDETLAIGLLLEDSESESEMNSAESTLPPFAGADDETLSFAYLEAGAFAGAALGLLGLFDKSLLTCASALLTFFFPGNDELDRTELLPSSILSASSPPASLVPSSAF